jgi:hypothetical protein
LAKTLQIRRRSSSVAAVLFSRTKKQPAHLRPRPEQQPVPSLVLGDASAKAKGKGEGEAKSAEIRSAE